MSDPPPKPVAPEGAENPETSATFEHAANPGRTEAERTEAERTEAAETTAPQAGHWARVEALLALLDRFAARAFHLALLWCWPLVYGLLLAVLVWWFSHDADRALVNNQLNPELRRSSLTWAGLGSVLGLVAMGVYAALVRLRGGNVCAAVKSANFALSPCLTVPLVLALCSPKIETERPLLAATLPLFVGLGWLVPFYRLAGVRLRRSPPAWAARALVALTLIGGWVAYGVFFSHAAILNHHGLMTSTFDLGLYDNIFYQSIHGTFLGCSFLANNYHGAAHFDPLLVLLSPVYLLYPRAESILVLQSFWLGAGVFPLYALARHRTGSRPVALVFSSMWLIYPALQGANMYDFHSLSLIAPVIVWLWYCIERESALGYWISVVVALLIREDVPLLLCFIAAAMLASMKPFQVRHAWRTIVVSIAYFLAAKLWFMGAPDESLKGTQTYTFDFYYKELIPNGTGIGELVSSLLTNPGFVVRLIFDEQKILFLLLVFVPLGMLPALARSGRIALVYGLVFCLLATREPVFSIYFQYVALLFSVAFPLTLHGLDVVTAHIPRLWPLQPARLRAAILGALVVCTAFVSLGFGGLVENDAFRGGFSKPVRRLSDRDRERYAWVQQAVARIPKEATVAATQRMGPHISNRAKAYGYPNRGNFDFLFVDETQIGAKRASEHQRFVREGYEELTRFEKLVLYGRKRP